MFCSMVTCSSSTSVVRCTAHVALDLLSAVAEHAAIVEGTLIIFVVVEQVACCFLDVLARHVLG